MPDGYSEINREALWRNWISAQFSYFRVGRNYPNALMIDEHFVEGIANELANNGVQDHLENVGRLIYKICEKKPGPISIERDEELSRTDYQPDVFLKDPQFIEVHERFGAHIGLALMQIEDQDYSLTIEFAKWLCFRKRTEKDIVHHLQEF
ncbi:MAG: hypothetical protein LBC63_02005 [Holophagales bacterium]|jgi:hypothetical protein|nr:hypothetical protein [Holophagales bacterium]